MPFFSRNQFEALCRVAASLGLSGGLAFDNTGEIEKGTNALGSVL